MQARWSSKFFKLVYNSTWTENFHVYKLDLEKAEETRNRIASIHWITGKARDLKKIHLCFIDYTKAFDYVDHNKTMENS